MANNEEELAINQPKPDAAAKKAKSSASKPKATSRAKTAATKPKDPAVRAVAGSTEPKSQPKPVIKATAKPATSVTNTEEKMTELSADAPSGDGKKLAIRIGVAAVGVLVVLLVVFGVMIYGYKSQNGAAKVAARVVPYPVEIVNGRWVAYKDYIFEVEANERAYQNNAKLNNEPAVDFSSTSGKKLATQIKQHVLDQLESEALIAQLASRNKVTVTSAQVNNVVNQLASRNGGQQTLLKVLKQTYGWNLNDLRGVVYKELLQQNLETKITSDPSVQAVAKAKATDVLNQINAGGDFSTLAKKYSQASDAASGGDLGYVTKDQLPAEEQSIAESMQVGAVSGVIKTQYGYEIIKLVDKRSDGSMHIQHILIETVDFNQYFQNQVKQAKLRKLISV